MPVRRVRIFQIIFYYYYPLYYFVGLLVALQTTKGLSGFSKLSEIVATDRSKDWNQYQTSYKILNFETRGERSWILKRDIFDCPTLPYVMFVMKIADILTTFC